MSKNFSSLSGRKGLTDNLFERLSENPDLEEIKEDFLIPAAPIVGSMSFYDLLREENKGKKVYVCNGSACMLAGTQDKLKTDLENHFKAEEIGELCCLGRCHENSAFQYDGRNYSARTTEELGDVFSKKSKYNGDSYHVGCHGKQILTSPTGDVAQYYQPLFSLFKREPAELLAEIKTSGLRGRGGAGFPMGIKLETFMNARDDQKYVVCNADEGDPGAYSDRYVMEQRPHALLYGMMVAGYIGGASDGILYIRAEYPESIRIMEQAIVDLKARKFIGKNIFATGFNFDFKIIAAQGAYICGEETALLSSIEGQRPMVRVRPPFPAEKGLFNKPTLVNNVETFAFLHHILENGGAAFKTIGTEQSSGTKLFSLDSYFNRPGIYEVEMGTPLATVIYELGKGFKSPVKALHIGGPLGGLVPVFKIEELNVSYESFRKGGFELGHASVVSIPENYPLIHYMEHLFEFCAHESCGKCFPCRLGSQRGMEMARKARTEGYKIDRTLMEDLLETMQIGSLCALGGGLPLPIKNALQYFDVELRGYFE